MASYMDMVTVLMCMFIVLFAMSTVDADKFISLRNSLATGFGQTDLGKIDTADGHRRPGRRRDAKGPGLLHRRRDRHEQGIGEQQAGPL